VGSSPTRPTSVYQDRWLAIDPVTCALIASYLAEIKAELADVGAGCAMVADAAERTGVPPPPRSALGLGGGLQVPEPGGKQAVQSAR
jgi:hypothetical protein